jgi:hypothetical protein
MDNTSLVNEIPPKVHKFAKNLCDWLVPQTRFALFLFREASRDPRRPAALHALERFLEYLSL